MTPATPTPTHPEKPLPIADDQQHQLAQHLSATFQHWKQQRQGLENKWRECWQAYLCQLGNIHTEPTGEAPDRSRIHRPVLYEAVEGIHANLMNALFPSDERFFSVLGTTEANHQNAGIIEAFLRQKLDKSSFTEKFSLFLKQALIVGNTIAAVPWQQRLHTRTLSTPTQTYMGASLPIGGTTSATSVTVAEGPEFDVIDMFDVVVDPNADRFENATLIHQVQRPLSYLQQHSHI